MLTIQPTPITRMEARHVTHTGGDVYEVRADDGRSIGLYPDYDEAETACANYDMFVDRTGETFHSHIFNWTTGDYA